MLLSQHRWLCSFYHFKIYISLHPDHFDPFDWNVSVFHLCDFHSSISCCSHSQNGISNMEIYSNDPFVTSDSAQLSLPPTWNLHMLLSVCMSGLVCLKCLPASRFHQAPRGQPEHRSHGMSLFWMTSIFSAAWEKKEVERHCSFGFELQLDPWPPSLRFGYQNTRPSACDCRASVEHGVNIIHLGSRIQTAIICYSHTQSYYLILESRQMEGGQSHPPLPSFAALPFLRCAERTRT